MKMSEFRNPTGVQWAGGRTHGMATYGEDSNLLVIFYAKSVENRAKSIEQGIRVFESRVYCKIQHPGENLNIIDKPADESLKQRFSAQWEAFSTNQTYVPEGTPIDLLFPNFPHVAETLRGLGVHTIQQCAGLSAHAISSLGIGGIEYVNKSKQYLESAKEGVGFHQFQKAITEKDTQIRILSETVSKLTERLDQIADKRSNPLSNPLNPPFIQGYDVQTDRINATHTSKPPVKVARKAPTLEITDLNLGLGKDD